MSRKSKSSPARLALAAVAASMTLAAVEGANAKAPPNPYARFSWMEGCWISEDGANREEWTTAFGPLMYGHAEVTGADGKVTFFEQSRIDMRGPRAVYTVSPDGQAPIPFFEDDTAAPTPGADGKPMPQVVFTAPDRGYPQRIAYRTDRKKLYATVSMMDGSQAANLEWKRCKR